MIERELRDGLVVAVSDEPPLSLDPDALVARAQRDTRRRRSLVGAGVLTVAIAIAAVAVPTVLHVERGRSTVTAASRLTSSVTVTTTPVDTRTPTTDPDVSTIAWPPVGVLRKVYPVATAKELASLWSTHLRATVPTVVPGVSKVYVRPWNMKAASSVAGRVGLLDTYVTFLAGDSSSAIYVQVSAPGLDTLGPASCKSDDQDECTARDVPGGGVATVSTYQTSDSDGSRVTSVTSYRLNGAEVQVTGYPYDPTAARASRNLSAFSPSTDQLMTLATDPRLGF